MDRKAKIQYLNNLQSGKAKISDLKEDGYQVWIEQDGFVHLYGNPEDLISTAQFEEYAKANPYNRRYLVEVVLNR